MADYLKECFQEAKDKSDVDASVEQFKQVFCNTCLNTECVNSKWRDSSWEERMRRQEETLNNPKFADPDDPEYEGISTQHFVSVEEAKQSQQYGGWVEVDKDGKVKREATEEPKRKRVHISNPPTQEKKNSALDHSQEVLEAVKKGEDPPPEEPKPKQKEKLSASEPQKEGEEEKPAPKRKPREGKQQGQPDQSGKMLSSSQPQKEKPSSLAQTPVKDDWSLPNEDGDQNDGPLVVTVSREDQD